MTLALSRDERFSAMVAAADGDTRHCTRGSSSQHRWSGRTFQRLHGEPSHEIVHPSTLFFYAPRATGLAIYGAIRGYPFIAVMSKGNSLDRARMMRSLGAEVVLVDQLPDSVLGQVSGGDLELVELLAQRVMRERGAFWADQFQREGNWLAHYKGTSPEIWEQTGGDLTASPILLARAAPTPA